MSAPDSKACKSRVWIVAVVWSLRLIVGSLFAMSGFVKMIDPWGFLFKLEEYLAVWHLTPAAYRSAYSRAMHFRL